MVQMIWTLWMLSPDSTNCGKSKRASAPNKHDLKIRPIYHWTPQRVRGVQAHIAICYMAFCCLQHLRKRLNMLGHPMSPARIRKELNTVQVSILRRNSTRKRYSLSGAVTTDAKTPVRMR